MVWWSGVVRTLFSANVSSLKDLPEMRWTHGWRDDSGPSLLAFSGAIPRNSFSKWFAWGQLRHGQEGICSTGQKRTYQYSGISMLVRGSAVAYEVIRFQAPDVATDVVYLLPCARVLRLPSHPLPALSLPKTTPGGPLTHPCTSTRLVSRLIRPAMVACGSR